jgi:hypothetical protein
LPKKSWTSIRHKAFELHLKKERHRTRYWHTYRKLPDIVLTDKQIGYFAGIIDGEGSISIVRSKEKGKVYYAPLISITNTNMALIQKCMDIFKSGRFYAEKRTKPGHKTKFVYNIGSVRGVRQILTQIIDELTVKKQHAKIVLEFIKVKEQKTGHGVSAREVELFEELKKLNAREKRKSLIRRIA